MEIEQVFRGGCGRTVIGNGAKLLADWDVRLGSPFRIYHSNLHEALGINNPTYPIGNDRMSNNAQTAPLLMKSPEKQGIRSPTLSFERGCSASAPH